MAFGPYTEQPTGSFDTDFSINHYENVASNYKKDGIDQVPFSVAINGVVPFLIRDNTQAYTVTVGKKTSE
jgi:hypothetical protein